MLCTSSVWKKFSGLNKLCKNNYFLRHIMTKSKGFAVRGQLSVLLLPYQNALEWAAVYWFCFFFVVVVCLCFFFFCFSVHFTVLSCAINPLEEANNFS